MESYIQSLLSLNKILLFFLNSTVSGVEILQMLRPIEFPLRFIRLDDHKLGIFAIFQELFPIAVVAMSTFENKNDLN